MPGKLNFVTQKLRSHSVPQLDVKKPEAISYEFVEVVEESDMSETESKNNTWFKTWPERSYDKLEQNSEATVEEEENPSSNIKSESVKSHIPLNKLLDNIPLAYSPITKQLHVLSPSEQRKEPVTTKCNNSCHKSEIVSDSDEEFDKFRTKSPDKNVDGRLNNKGLDLNDSVMS